MLERWNVMFDISYSQIVKVNHTVTHHLYFLRQYTAGVVSGQLHCHPQNWNLAIIKYLSRGQFSIHRRIEPALFFVYYVYYIISTFISKGFKTMWVCKCKIVSVRVVGMSVLACLHQYAGCQFHALLWYWVSFLVYCRPLVQRKLTGQGGGQSSPYAGTSSRNNAEARRCLLLLFWVGSKLGPTILHWSQSQSQAVNQYYQSPLEIEKGSQFCYL